jgi:hypothetical protein
MNKRANLAAALQTATRGVEATPPQAAVTVTALRTTTPSRIGKKTVAAHFDPAVSRQLKQLGLDRDTSTQALLREALNDLFTKYGKPPIA